MTDLHSHQQRELDRLTGENESTVAADARFFKRRPDRRHRLRVASTAEVATLYLLWPDMAGIDGTRWYAAVRCLAPGVRFRLFVLGPPDLDCDMPEAVCRRVYEANQPEEGRQAERAALSAIAARETQS